MINVPHSILLILITAALTFGLRLLPFALFGGKRQMKPTLQRTTELLPAAVMAILVVYCLKADICAPETGTLATAVAIIVVIILHLWKRNTLLSILASTAVYMICIRLLPL